MIGLTVDERSSERAALREAVEDFLAKENGEPQVRLDMARPDGFDQSRWALFADQLGLAGLAVPERLGGVGGDFCDIAVVLEEFGATLSGLPFLSSAVLAPAALLACADPAAERWLGALAEGGTRGTVAFLAEQGGWDVAGVGPSAVLVDGQWRLDGIANYVLDGGTANVIVVFARSAAGLSQFAVEAGASGLSAHRLATLDQTRRMVRLELSEVPAQLLGANGGAAPALASLLDTGAAALAVEAVGGIRRTLEISVNHAGVREQFGRKIGSFQAIKHRCAEMLVDLESARAVAASAVSARADDSEVEDLARTAATAKAFCSDAYLRAVRGMIQILGGTGFTWEHPAHLYFKRATSDAVLYGDPRHHRRRLAVQLGLVPASSRGEEVAR